MMHSQDEGVIATNDDASMCKRYLELLEDILAICMYLCLGFFKSVYCKYFVRSFSSLSSCTQAS